MEEPYLDYPISPAGASQVGTSVHVRSQDLAHFFVGNSRPWQLRSQEHNVLEVLPR